MRQVSVGGKRDMSIKSALEWAFGTELARLDFEDVETSGGTSTIYRLMQQGQLGCKIDGGGRSRAADDAEVIANAVAALPVALGGKPMAANIAAWARAGIAPDWQIDLTPRCVPRQWSSENQHGRFAKTTVVETVEIAGKRGRMARFDVLVCPITFVPTAAQVAMARRRYLDWCLALAHMHSVLAPQGVLQQIRLTSFLPSAAPWEEKAEEAA